jgi:hypothetical protein
MSLDPVSHIEWKARAVGPDDDGITSTHLRLLLSKLVSRHMSLIAILPPSPSDAKPPNTYTSPLKKTPPCPKRPGIVSSPLATSHFFQL